MSVKRLVVAADVSTLNVSAFCLEHGISRWLFYDLRRRYEIEGDAALEPKSRANTGRVANKTPVAMEDLIVRTRKDLDDAGLDAGAATIGWHLRARGECGVPSDSTIGNVLLRRGFITPDPSKSPKKSWKRFQADRANELWQIDGTDWTLACGQGVKIINIVDDAARLLAASLAAESESFDAALAALFRGAESFGLPERVLHDNGKGLLKLDTVLSALGIRPSKSRIYHPQTCGKVERFHQTLKKWLTEQEPASTLAELQTLLDTFAGIYNNTRPHRSLPKRIPPAQRWNDMAKSGPANQPLPGPSRIYQNTVQPNGICTAGQNCSISLGNKHAGKLVDIIITGTNAHVFTNGELIRKLTIDPTRRVQPLHPHRGRPQ